MFLRKRPQPSRSDEDQEASSSNTDTTTNAMASADDMMIVDSNDSVEEKGSSSDSTMALSGSEEKKSKLTPEFIPIEHREKKEKPPKRDLVSEILPNDLNFVDFEESVSFSPLVKKRVLQQGEGLTATPGSVIRFFGCAKLFYKNTEQDVEWSCLTASNNLLQEIRLRPNKVYPVQLDCLYTMKQKEKAIFSIAKNVDKVLDITLFPTGDGDHVSPGQCHDYVFVQYYEMTHLERKEIVNVTNFEEGLNEAIKKRTAGNLEYKDCQFKKALKTYKTALICLSNVKLDDPENQELCHIQKKLITDEKVKLLLNIARTNSIMKDHRSCIETCQNILTVDSNNHHAHYLLGKSYNCLDDYERGVEHIEKAKVLFASYQSSLDSNTVDNLQQKKDEEFVNNLSIIERQLRYKKQIQEQKFDQEMKQKMSRMFSEELYPNQEPYDEAEDWMKMQEQDELLNRKPWFSSEGQIMYQRLFK
ncbi:hypothetical protein C9374_005603 [Naegleria lovaniensis]|uniref:peptidylprolyl isomerase n=1 Tax=Naegleria lovaniensis TaxID=51637 RepID=A0AA88KNB7_NAELO|nr:uncharacterized protein C9374_005603 [Naegleria lovaniensis]KAG2382401.1 hypothetical protein C9374_005603 [Naegleria lovaniensis]